MVPAWAFVLDGHIFYVLNDLDGETFVFDVRTGQWHHWYTGLLGGKWEMYRGLVWKGRTLAAHPDLGRVWELDPNSTLDEDALQIKRLVTGFQAVRGKSSVRQGSLRLTASVGDPAPGAAVELRFSDDEGETWSVVHSRVLEEANYAQQLRFRSLGRLREPGRIWEISDIGGIVTIEGADSDMEIKE